MPVMLFPNARLTRACLPAFRTPAEENKPRYIAEMEKYKSMSCGSDTKHDRPLVK